MATVLINASIKAQVKPGDETSIKQIIQTMQDGWNNKDGNLFASRFTDDCDYVVVNGMFLKTRKVVAEGHQGIFNSIYKETNLELNLRDARYLADDIIIAHVDGRRFGNIFGKYEDAHAIMTFVLQKLNGNWSIAAFQNTEIQQQGQAPPGKK